MNVPPPWLLSSRAATISSAYSKVAEPMWGRMASCGRLPIGQMPEAAYPHGDGDTRLRLAAMWGRLPACGRLLIGLPL